ncbi:MAG: MOSC domain-containing protein [Nisaea sp.]|uniref:MOSC domain-containing protein n=1 Tax=Nisaea sp. TaxID=2024842 RepID=UPI001B10A366|nr:MOSC domain-containing protein [Nisaea sp.]MBO6560291.1 MOSC domain-containing protein [Nisaea sp.]
MYWTGRLDHIHICAKGSQDMAELKEANLVAGKGIEGDRYFLGTGTYSDKPAPDRQVTLIESETLEALARDHNMELTPVESRRNLTVTGVPLNHLVGKRFRVGEVVLYGGRLNTPCQYLDDLLGKKLFKLLLNRSGLNCEIVEGGVIRPGDTVSSME